MIGVIVLYIICATVFLGIYQGGTDNWVKNIIKAVFWPLVTLYTLGFYLTTD